MPIEVIIMMIGMGLGGHFNKALEDLIPIHAKAVMEFCESFAAKKKEGEQKAKEDELKDAGLFIKPQIS
jgi:hypothetical protein